MPNLGYVNGTFSPLEEATISINDRGFLFGDSVYEVIRCYGEHPFLLKDHLSRLQVGLDSLGIDGEQIVSSLPSIIQEGLVKSEHRETTVYIQVTRGVHLRSIIAAEDLTPTLVVTFREISDQLFQKKREEGVSIWLHPDTRWARRALKTTNLLPNVLIRNEADKLGFFDAAMFQPDNTVTECCSSTMFIVENGKIITTPDSSPILHGVTRKWFIEAVVPRIGMKVREELYSVERLRNASEVLLTSTTYTMLPVINVDTTIIGNGVPGSISKALVQEAFSSVQEFCAATPSRAA